MPTKKPDTYNRSRIEILHHILQFSTGHYFGDKKEGHENIWMDVENCFRGGYINDFPIEIGSLCVLSACKSTKWYLSWCLDIKEGGDWGSKQYLMKSVEDGELIWWHNVAVYQYPKEKTELNPHWKFTDKQFEVWDKWKRVFQKRDSFSLRSMLPVFNNEDNSVILKCSARWMEDKFYEKKFDNWKTLTQKQMLEFYDECDSINSKK